MGQACPGYTRGRASGLAAWAVRAPGPAAGRAPGAEIRRALSQGSHGAGELEDAPHVRPRPALHTPPPTLARARAAASMRGAALCGAQQMSMRSVKAPPER